MDPRPGRAVIPAVQEDPLAMPEATKVEVTAVFEEVARGDATVLEIVVTLDIPAITPVDIRAVV
jgi:hypothetical protein